MVKPSSYWWSPWLQNSPGLNSTGPTGLRPGSSGTQRPCMWWPNEAMPLSFEGRFLRHQWGTTSCYGWGHHLGWYTTSHTMSYLVHVDHFLVSWKTYVGNNSFWPIAKRIPCLVQCVNVFQQLHARFSQLPKNGILLFVASTQDLRPCCRSLKHGAFSGQPSLFRRCFSTRATELWAVTWYDEKNKLPPKKQRKLRREGGILIVQSPEWSNIDIPYFTGLL